jgi:probable F420-dependent oxidoreductase
MSENTKLQFGMVLPTRESVMFGSGDPQPLLRQAERAEELGFDSVWAGESLFARPRFDPLVLLSSVAMRTKRTTLGTAILLAAQRHPLQVAHAAATLDQLSRGRLVLGIAAGAGNESTKREFEAVGVPFAERFGRLAEAAELWRVLWGGPVKGFQSRYWQIPDLDLHPKPKQPAGPPVWLGGEGPKTLERAGSRFSGWFPFSPTSAAYAKGWASVRQAAETAGRDPNTITRAVYLTITIDNNPQKAETEQRRYMEAYYSMPYETMRTIQGCYAGTLESTVDWLGGYIQAGARHIVLRFATQEPMPQLEAANTICLRVLAAPKT